MLRIIGGLFIGTLFALFIFKEQKANTNDKKTAVDEANVIKEGTDSKGRMKKQRKIKEKLNF